VVQYEQILRERVHGQLRECAGTVVPYEQTVRFSDPCLRSARPSIAHSTQSPTATV